LTRGQYCEAVLCRSCANRVNARTFRGTELAQDWNRVLGISVPDLVLHDSQIGALVRQVVATGKAKHVRPDAAELRLFAGEPETGGPHAFL